MPVKGKLRGKPELQATAVKLVLLLTNYYYYCYHSYYYCYYYHYYYYYYYHYYYCYYSPVSPRALSGRVGLAAHCVWPADAPPRGPSGLPCGGGHLRVPHCRN